MCYTAYESKWRSVVFNYRGCNGIPLTSPKGYSPVVTDDVYAVVDEIKRCSLPPRRLREHEMPLAGDIPTLPSLPPPIHSGVSCCANILAKGIAMTKVAWQEQSWSAIPAACSLPRRKSANRGQSPGSSISSSLTGRPCLPSGI